jgi:hypothetical protein
VLGWPDHIVSGVIDQMQNMRKCRSRSWITRWRSGASK